MIRIDRINDRITMFTFDQLRTSWLIRDRRNILIESGFFSNAPELLGGLGKISLTARDIDFLALTHVHLDHAGGAGLIARQNPGLKVFVHENGARHLSDPRKLMEGAKKAYGNNEFSSDTEMVPIPKEQIIPVDSGHVVKILGIRTWKCPTLQDMPNIMSSTSTRPQNLFSQAMRSEANFQGFRILCFHPPPIMIKKNLSNPSI